MKNIKKLYEELDNRSDFRVIRTGFDGGMGEFVKGSQKGMTVIWSFGGGWEHISIDGKKRMPTWDEMCQLKDIFFDDDECCVQYHPPKSEYVNNIPYCLHIWKPIEQYSGNLPMPPSIFTGLKGVKLRKYGEDAKMRDGDEFVAIFNNCTLAVSNKDGEAGFHFIGGKPLKVDMSLGVYEDVE